MEPSADLIKPAFQTLSCDQLTCWSGPAESNQPQTAYERWWAKYGKAWLAKQRREEAQLLHRANLLCLLARGQLLNEAASHPLVQAIPQLSRSWVLRLGTPSKTANTFDVE